MFHKKFLQMTADIKQFTDGFKQKYGLDLIIDIGNDLTITCNSPERMTLESLEKITIKAMHEYEPCLKKYKTLKLKNRSREYMIWVQIFSYIAWMNGYSKLAIGNELGKTHASVINHIKNTQNALEIGYKEWKEIYNYLLKQYFRYVGIITESITRESDTKSIASPVFIK